MSGQKFALALSGGGLRAALFQCGGFLALASKGMLSDIDNVSAISGGCMAALALDRAWIAPPAGGTPESEAARLARELQIANDAYRAMSKLSGMDMRTTALLSKENIARVFCVGEHRLTEGIAKLITEVHRASKPGRCAPPLRFGVWGLGDRKLLSVAPHANNPGMATAAAMALPGMLDAVVLDDIKQACIDGGVSDKTGLEILRDIDWTGKILLLDASLPMEANTQARVSAIASLALLIEAPAEAKRDVLIRHFGQQLTVAALRNPDFVGLDAECLQFLSNARTDIDYFSSIEEMSLVAAGFAVTCAALGDAAAAIDTNCAQLAAREASINITSSGLPLGPRLSMVLRALGVHNTDQESQRVRHNLRHILKKSNRSLFRNQGSSHPYLRTIGWFSAAWGVIMFMTMLAFTGLMLFLSAAVLQLTVHIPIFHSLLAVNLIVGLCYLWTSVRKECPVPNFLASAVCVFFLPVCLILTQTARAALGVLQGTESLSSLRFNLSLIGRVRELLDWKYGFEDTSITFKLKGIVASLFLLVFLIVNPLWVFPAWKAIIVAPFPHMGISEFMLGCPIFPNAFLLTLTVELGVRIWQRLTSFIRSTYNSINI